jgi:hypothetical protein
MEGIPTRSRAGVFAALAVVVLAGGGGAAYLLTRPKADAAATPAPAAAAATPAVAEKVTIKVTSEPKGAEVYRDGNWVGNTPTQFETAKGGPVFKLEMRLAGYGTQSRSIDPTQGFDLALRLDPEAGTATAATPATTPATSPTTTPATTPTTAAVTPAEGSSSSSRRRRDKDRERDHGSKPAGTKPAGTKPPATTGNNTLGFDD